MGTTLQHQTESVGYQLKTAPGYIEFPSTNITASLFVVSEQDQQYTGTIRSITYTLKRQSDNASVSYTTGGSDADLTSFIDDYIRVAKSSSTNGIKITTDLMPDEAEFYTLTATVQFISGKKVVTTATIVIQQDSDVIVNSAKTTVYNPINDTKLT